MSSTVTFFVGIIVQVALCILQVAVVVIFVYRWQRRSWQFSNIMKIREPLARAYCSLSAVVRARARLVEDSADKSKIEHDTAQIHQYLTETQNEILNFSVEHFKAKFWLSSIQNAQLDVLFDKLRQGWRSVRNAVDKPEDDLDELRREILKFDSICGLENTMAANGRMSRFTNEADIRHLVDPHRNLMQEHLTYTKSSKGIVIRSDFWTVEHRTSAGGCWSSIRFRHGSGKNLLAAPLTSKIHFVHVRKSGDEDSTDHILYQEHLDRHPKISVTQNDDGRVTVVAEGVYTDAKGGTIPVRFRHRYEYGHWGLVTSDLDIIPDGPCRDVMEVGAAQVELRPGLTHAYVRDHPIPNFNSDLRAGFKWLPLAPGAGYRSKYVPLHVVCFEKGVEGIEFFAPSDLAEWDRQLCPDVGFGLYLLATDQSGKVSVNLSPYCVAFRRVPVTLDKPSRFRLYWGLPFIREASRLGAPLFHAAVSSNWPSDADLERLASTGVRLIRFHNDYREDGPFWHDGAYPPYDEAGMRELWRIIDTSHRLGMKIVPYMSLKEFHPVAPGYAEHADAWAQAPSPSVRDIHTWAGSGEYGRLMCMESGWLNRRKRDVDTILSDLPWDGLYFDWCTPLPCRNPAHLDGQCHTDTDAYLEFLAYCRQRIGEKGFLFLHLSGHPYLVAENMSDLAFIFEDVGGSVRHPSDFPPHCEFVPIVTRQLATGAAAGSLDSRRLLMSTFLQGHSLSTYAPIGEKGFHVEVLREMEMLGAEDFAAFRFQAASDHPVETGRPEVEAALWTRRGRAIVYLANFSAKPVRGRMRFDPATFVGKSARAPLAGELRHLSGKIDAVKIGAGSLRKQGVAYALKPWESAVLHLKS